MRERKVFKCGGILFHMASKISASQIQTYFFCPRAYKYAYLDKKDGIKSRELKIGTIFHERISNYLSKKNDILKLPKKWKYSFDLIMEQISPEYHVEYTVLGKINNLDAIGIIDLLSLDDNVIIDWKTSKYTKINNVQAYFYYELVKQVFNKKCDIAFVFLKHGEIKWVNKNSLINGEKAVSKFLERRENGEYPKYMKYNKKCIKCSYSLVCFLESEELAEKDK